MRNKASDLRTLCVHAGELKDTQHGGAISPLFASTSYAFNDVDIKQYPRYFNTPNQRGLCEKIAALEGAGSTTAAQFLQRFILNKTPWAHLDIAGMAFSKYGGALNSGGATGFGVRLLNKLIEDDYE